MTVAASPEERTFCEVRIKADPEHMEAALAILRRESEEFGKYDKIGWGWAFGNCRDGPRFFVRRISNGLSANQTHPPMRALHPTEAGGGS